MFSDPCISVVIPHYNQNEFLVHALESVARQKYLPYEVIVVDDGSDRPPQDLMDAFKDRLKLQIILHQTNRGVSAARNKGISASTGSYIALLDADDLWGRDHLFRFAECAKQNNVFYYSAGAESQAFIRNTKQQPASPVCYKDNYFKQAVKNSMIVNSSSVVMHRKVFEQVGYFDTDLRVFEDMDFWMRAGRVFPLYHTPQTNVFIRPDTPGSLTKRPELYLENAIKHFFERHLEAVQTQEEKHFVQQNILGTILHFRIRQQTAPGWLDSLLEPEHLSLTEYIKWKIPVGMFRFLHRLRKSIK